MSTTDPQEAQSTIRSLAQEIGTVIDVASRRSDPDHDHRQMIARLTMWRKRLLDLDAALAAEGPALNATGDTVRQEMAEPPAEGPAPGEAERLKQAERELNEMRIEMNYLATREYSDNAAECYDNRRRLGRQVAKALKLTPVESEEMRLAATEHGTTGGEIILWLVNKLRAENAKLRALPSQPVRAEALVTRHTTNTRHVPPDAIRAGIDSTLHAAVRAEGTPLACDCGAALTVCSDCAVADYQSQHTDCSTCCKSPGTPPADTRGQPERRKWRRFPPAAWDALKDTAK